MSTQKKNTSPDYYWVDFATELINLSDQTTDEVSFYQNLFQGREDLELLDVAAFCTVTPPAYSEPGLGDLVAGSAVTKYKNCVYNAVFYLLCEEV